MNALRLPDPAFRLRFEPVAKNGCALDIPCDADGHVDLDTLSEPSRNAYLYARVLRGRLFSVSVVPLDRH